MCSAGVGVNYGGRRTNKLDMRDPEDARRVKEEPRWNSVCTRGRCQDIDEGMARAMTAVNDDKTAGPFGKVGACSAQFA